MLRALLAVRDVRPIDRARWAADLGDFDAVFKYLDQAAAERDIRLPYVVTWKEYSPLWSDPRFQALLQRMGLLAYRRR